MAFSSSNRASVVASPKQLSHEGVVLYGCCFIGLVPIGLFDSTIARIVDYSGLLYMTNALHYFAFMDRILARTTQNKGLRIGTEPPLGFWNKSGKLLK
jgi:hypothetical protein